MRAYGRGEPPPRLIVDILSTSRSELWAPCVGEGQWVRGWVVIPETAWVGARVLGVTEREIGVDVVSVNACVCKEKCSSYVCELCGAVLQGN